MGRRRTRRRDYATALKTIRPLAEQGDAEAQTYLGVMYVGGLGVQKDEKEAAKWFRLSAAKGNADAQCNLALLYVSGEGVAQDFKEAAKWYRLAADQGNARAQFSLGVMYSGGIGVAKDEKKAAELVRLAAEKGNAPAQNLLGEMLNEGTRRRGRPRGIVQMGSRARRNRAMPARRSTLGFKYEFGNGVAQDSVRALMWVTLGAAQGAKDLQVSLHEIEADMTPEQIAEAQALATKCKASGYKACD